jgi:hypothetical protein
MAVDLHHWRTQERAPRRRVRGHVAAQRSRGTWTFLEGSTVTLTVRHLSHHEPIAVAPLTGRIVSDGTGSFLLSAAANLADASTTAGPEFRSRRILADDEGRLTIPGSLVLSDQLLELSFHGALLPAEPGDEDGVIRAEAHAELDRAGMRFLAGALETAVLHLGHGRLDVVVLAAAEQ